MSYVSKKQKSTTTLCVFTLCALLAYPEVSKAGVLDNLSTLIQNFTGSKKEEVDVKNSQTVELLRPAALQAQKNTSPAPVVGAVSVSVGPLRISTEDEIYLPDVDTISVYVVKETDTLNSIAKLYGVSVNTIVWANDLSSRKVTEGQVLTILPISGTRHTIKKGDTLKTIASKYSADERELALFNGITGESSLAVGDSLIVPDGEVMEEKTPEASKPKEAKTIKNTITKNVKAVIKNLAREGYYMRPISGGSRTTGLHGNNAVDLAAPSGTSIVASASGRVIISKVGGYNGGYGNYLVIAHPNGTQTLYAHNSDNLVETGENVRQGQVIAKVGSTGRSTGAHVHFEVRGARNPF